MSENCKSVIGNAVLELSQSQAILLRIGPQGIVVAAKLMFKLGKISNPLCPIETKQVKVD